MKRLLLALLLLLPCLQVKAQRILFVGNSLTYSNGLPTVVENIGQTLGKKIVSECICLPNYSLEDHWNDGLVQRKLEEGAFDFVIFQQGPSSQSNGFQTLLAFGGKISQKALEHDTQPAYLMVWPSLRYYQTFDGVIENHTDAARQNKALLIPLGQIWKAHRETPNRIKLYSEDGFHPSKEGSALAAIAIIKTLFPETDLGSIRYKFQYGITKKAFKELIKVVAEF